MADSIDLDQRLMDDCYSALRCFLRMLRDPACKITFTLKAGQ